jgi:hypothetical protein
MVSLLAVVSVGVAVCSVVPLLGMLAVSGTDPDWEWHDRFWVAFWVMASAALGLLTAAVVIAVI